MEALRWPKGLEYERLDSKTYVETVAASTGGSLPVPSR